MYQSPQALSSHFPITTTTNITTSQPPTSPPHFPINTTTNITTSQPPTSPTHFPINTTTNITTSQPPTSPPHFPITTTTNISTSQPPTSLSIALPHQHLNQHKHHCSHMIGTTNVLRYAVLIFSSHSHFLIFILFF